MNFSRLLRFLFDLLLFALAAFILFIVTPKIALEWHGYFTPRSASEQAQFGLGAFAEGATVLVAFVGSALALTSFFQGRLAVWQRVLLAVFCALPLAATLLAVRTVGSPFYRPMFVHSCLIYPIPLWLLCLPGVVVGVGVLSVLAAMARWVFRPRSATA